MTTAFFKSLASIIIDDAQVFMTHQDLAELSVYSEKFIMNFVNESDIDLVHLIFLVIDVYKPAFVFIRQEWF